MNHIVWFSFDLWHINQCRLFNVKCIFIHINISISNNSVKHRYSFLFTHGKSKEFYLKLFSSFNSAKLFQVLLYITNNSIKHQSFI